MLTEFGSPNVDCDIHINWWKSKDTKDLKAIYEVVIIDFRSELSLFFTEWQPAHTQFFVMTYFHIHTNMVHND